MSDFSQIHPEQIEHRLRAFAGEFTRVRVVRFSAAPCWTPAINVYRCYDRFVVCVDLAGVHKCDLSVQAEPRRLRISGHRLPPEPQVEPLEPMRVLAMEIDYGRFERELRLPEAINPERASAEQREGWLWIQLPLRPSSSEIALPTGRSRGTTVRASGQRRAAGPGRSRCALATRQHALVGAPCIHELFPDD